MEWNKVWSSLTHLPKCLQHTGRRRYLPPCDTGAITCGPQGCIRKPGWKWTWDLNLSCGLWVSSPQHPLQEQQIP